MPFAEDLQGMGVTWRGAKRVASDRQVQISPQMSVFIAMATAICSLGHGPRLIAVPSSTQCCITSGSLNRVPASARARAGCHFCRVAGNTV